MTEPYYEDESVTLYHGDCLRVLPALKVQANVLLTDPPYFQVKDDEWDRQWKQADEFLTWLGSVLDAATPALAPSASAWVFAGPALASRVELEVVAPRLRVLNSVRWVKDEGWHKKTSPAAQRRYLTAWEGVVFAERYDYAYPAQALSLARDIFAPFGRYIQTEREKAGVTRQSVAVALAASGIYRNVQTGAAMCSDWELGDSIPTADGYAVLRSVLGSDFLSREYDELVHEWKTLRRPFVLSRTAGPVSDVWSFPTVPAYPGKHPCEKPLVMLAHMIETTSRPGDLILDPFAGSGSTADAARATGRRCVLIEKDVRYCEQIARRLAQGDLFGDAA